MPEQNTRITDLLTCYRTYLCIDEARNAAGLLNDEVVKGLTDEEVLHSYALFTAADEIGAASRLLDILTEQKRSLEDITARLESSGSRS